MDKDDHLIYESLVQSRAPMSDEQAAKMITDKIKGTPNLNIQNIKMYVQRYMGLTGKAPSDVDFIAAMVHDNLQNMGMGENAEGLSDAEYHKARKDALHGAGEELGHGPIKVQLKQNTTIDCYKAGTVQGVRFVKGTIFNCDENVGDYYECDTEEYGGVAVFPDDVTVLSGEENAEQGTSGKRRLKYDYEWVTAFLPRDLDISNRAAQEKVLDLAFQETLKRLVPTRKNPRLAARNMFGDEDFPMEIISQYAWYQEHGFPNASEDGWYDVQDTEENAENTQPADVSDSIRMKLGQAHDIVKGLIALLDKTPTGQTPYNEMAITHLVNLQEDLKELTMILQDRMLKK